MEYIIPLLVGLTLCLAGAAVSLTETHRIAAKNARSVSVDDTYTYIMDSGKKITLRYAAINKLIEDKFSY